MTPARRRSPGSVSIENVSNSALAIGDNARASNVVEAAQVALGETELAALRAALVDLVTSGARPGGVDNQAIGSAIDDVDELDEQLHTAEPDPGKVERLLQRMTATLAGVAGVGEAVNRVVQAISSVFGLR